jgi:DNA-binding response OmpR family regulator
VLLIEDDPAVAQVLIEALENAAYRVVHAPSGAQAKVLLAQALPDLIILDLILADTDGLVLCADIRARCDTPIIVCSATTRKRDALLALRLGADDFVPKPFDLSELLTRVAVVHRRARPDQPQPDPSASYDVTIRPSSLPTSPTIADGTRIPPAAPALGDADLSVGPLWLAHARRHVTLAGETLRLTPTEYRLLSILMSRPEEVFSREELSHLIWGYEDTSIGRSINIHVHRLRTKMRDVEERTGVPLPSVLSVRGFGFKLTVPTEPMGAPLQRKGHGAA